MNITNLEMAQASMEIFAGCICLMLCLIILMNRHKVRSMRIFVWMFFTTSILFFSESAAYIFRGNTDTLSIVITRITNFIVFFLDYFLADLFVRYIYSLIEENGYKLPRKYLNFVDACVLFAVALLVLNIFTGWMYTFDANNYYHRQPLWYLFSAVSALCLLVGAYAAIRYREFVNKITIISICIYLAAPVIFIVLQSYFYGLSIVNLGIFIGAISMLIVYLIGWSRGNYVDQKTVKKKRMLLQIVALFTIMVISMSASIFSCIASIRRISRNTSEKESHIISQSVHDNIIKDFLAPITVALTLSNDGNLAQMLSLPENDPTADSLIINQLVTIREGFQYQTVFAVNDKTKTYYTQKGVVKTLDLENDPHDIWYKDFLATGKRYEFNIDTDESNGYELGAFINTRVNDKDGNLIGACGLGVNMAALRDRVDEFEKEYNIDIKLADKSGLIMLSNKIEEVETEHIDNSYFDKVGNKEFYYENLESDGVSRLTIYDDLLDWYLVITDNEPNKINPEKITTPSIIIFIAGLFMMALAFGTITIREQKAEDALRAKKEASRTDELTGLLNRHAYQEDLDAIISEGKIYDYTYVMLDVNGLKTVNDNIGHAAGDELLLGAAHCMISPFNEHGRVYRIGGDEFVAILHCDKEKVIDAMKTFDHITATWKGTLVNELAVSKGVAYGYEHNGKTIEEIIEAADKLMYADKAAYYERTGKTRRK